MSVTLKKEHKQVKQKRFPKKSEGCWDVEAKNLVYKQGKDCKGSYYQVMRERGRPNKRSGGREEVKGQG